MDLVALGDQLASEALALDHKQGAKPLVDDPLRGMTPEEAEKEAEKLLDAAIDAQRQIADLKSQLAPVLKLANALGTSRRFQQMVKAADAELVAIGALFVKLRETEGHYKTGTQAMLIKVLLATNPELEDLLDTAKEKARTFNQGFSKVQTWDKKPIDMRKKAPYEVRLSNERVASLDKEAGIWDVLKKVYKGVRKLSDAGITWAQSLFTFVYEDYFGNLVDNLRKIRRTLERAAA